MKVFTDDNVKKSFLIQIFSHIQIYFVNCSWNETGKSRKFLKIVSNKFAYPEYRLNSEGFGQKLTKFIEQYKEHIPDFLKKVESKIKNQ